jgi:formamidopyrimidine-DNA glycosylase
MPEVSPPPPSRKVEAPKDQPTNHLPPSQIGEVARVVHYLRKHTLNRTIASITTTEDTIVYGKVGTSASDFQKATSNRTITGVGQQGKYFYVTFDKSPHAVMHLGMTGWVKFSSEDSGYYRSKKEVEEGQAEWPPKYMKWLWKFEKEAGGEKREAVEVAFVDPRRLARIRLVECEAGEVREHSPLKENGPDPVVDKEEFTFEFLKALLGKKKVPVKALLLDQANISGKSSWKLARILPIESPFLLTSLPPTQESATGSPTKSSTKPACTRNNTATPSPPSKSNACTTRSCRSARPPAKPWPTRPSSPRPG